MRLQLVSSIRRRFQRLSQSEGGQVAHVLLTRSPLIPPKQASFIVRLACVKHAASFILSQDQTLRKKEMHAHRGEKPARSEFETDQRDDIIADFIRMPTPRKDWSLIQRNFSTSPKTGRGINWHLTSARC